jgi:hypothetical protein
MMLAGVPGARDLFRLWNSSFNTAQTPPGAVNIGAARVILDPITLQGANNTRVRNSLSKLNGLFKNRFDGKAFDISILWNDVAVENEAKREGVNPNSVRAVVFPVRGGYRMILHKTAFTSGNGLDLTSIIGHELSHVEQYRKGVTDCTVVELYAYRWEVANAALTGLSTTGLRSAEGWVEQLIRSGCSR